MRYSIITVCKNADNALEKTIKSVVSQKLVDFEYIIIDGASTDKTIDIIRKYQKHLAFWISEPDSGIYPAMNKALTKSKGEWVYFINAGDTFLNNHVLSDLKPVLKENDLVYGNVEMETEKSRIINKFNRVNRWFWLQKTICHQAVFAKKELFEKWGNFNTQYKIAADYEWLLRMVFKYKAVLRYADINIAGVDMTGVSNNPQTRSLVLSEYASIRSAYFNRAEIKFLKVFENVMTYLVKIKRNLY